MDPERPGARVLDPGCAGSAYATVQDAIDAASNGDVVELCAGTFTEQLEITGKILTLRSVSGADGTIVDADGLGRALNITADAIVTVQGLTFRNGSDANGRGGNIQCDRSNLLLRDSVLEAGEAERGGGLGMSGCTGRLLDNTFRDNQATERGGGLYVEGTVDLLGNTFEDNASDEVAGAALLKDSFALIRGNTVIANTSDNDGAGFYVQRGAPWVDANVFRDNHAGSEGGGLRVKSSEAVVTDNTFTDNDADWRGGGMKMSHEESVISGNIWVGNHAGSKGGAMLLYESASTLTFEHFEGNDADEGGAVAILEGWDGPVFEDCTFEDNEADLGGHMYIDLEIETVTLRRVDFEDGRAEQGGAVYSEPDSDLDFRNVLFARNTATTGGGAVSLDATTGKIQNAVVIGNDAPDGAALRVTNGVTFDVANTVFTENTGGATIRNVLGPGPLFGVPWGEPPTFRYDDFYANTWDFLDLPFQVGTNGNVAVPPEFVGAAIGDWTLQSTSLLRNAGDPSISDVDGSRSDIGLHGGPYAD
jgi:predicted outer membrane repeat protein